MEIEQCSYTKPLRYNGTVPTNVQDAFNFASSTCTTTSVTIEQVEVLNFASSTHASTTRGYDGANLNEWLFVVGVILFFISWQTWSRISITKET